ncbi:DNA (cytosine-5-)-methyltransferase [uncultured Draconibacterium sp.]|uniref:DNA cytosine methyltransferase n=1 Tax=uncultured Draconibacterium sp. TaxID=1573823 RepID=UPI0029C79332|nr:DNA (cytosine-5-)-methyltransferase [uncultured Draconibacterium sp.]
MNFIDLFAGIGGFHVALSTLGHRCVYASEIVTEYRRLYHENFGIEASGDIKNESVLGIPQHDILCAGFPCQPFSKAGYQQGLSDEDRGTLFYDIARILAHHRPRYFILENVPNLEYHNEGKTWAVIRETLENELGYSVAHKKLSPHVFGVPQLRERMIIVGALNGLDHFEWPESNRYLDVSLNDILLEDIETPKNLPERELECLNLWQEFLDRLPKSTKLPSFPIWSMEFGATYPFEEKAPVHLKKQDLDAFLGCFGQSLHGMSKKRQMERLPSYARSKPKSKTKQFPAWKKRFISQNREFYQTYKRYIDPLIPRLEKMAPSWQKFEWNCQGEERDIFKKIIQFRGSGIRVKRPEYSPALVASTSTQIPIIGWEKRYLSIEEGLRLQSLNGVKLKTSEGLAYQALGNAVNAKVIELVANNLIQNDMEHDYTLIPPIEEELLAYSSIDQS